MSGNPNDPDFSSVPTSLPGPVSGSSATGTNLAQLRADMATMAETNKGSAINAAKDRIAEIAAAGRALEMNLLIIETAAKELKEAQAAWEKAAEGAKKADLDKADEEVQAAKTKLAQAQTIENQARDAVNAANAAVEAAEKNSQAWYDALQTWSAASTALDAAVTVTKAAQTALDAARKKAADLKAKNKAANDDLRRAYRSIAAKLGTIDRSVLGGGRSRWDGGTERGAGRPGTVNVPGYREPYSPGAGPGAGTARGSGSGAGAPKGGKEMPSMPSTPAKPAETGSGKTGGTPDATSQALAQLLHGQQQQQQPQAAAGTPQQATPAATAPQTQPQEQKKPGEKSELEKEAEKNGRTVLEAAGLESPLGGGVPLTVAPAVNTVGPQSAPSGQNGTAFRPGYTPAGTTTGGNPIPAQPAATTGSSVTGMNTKADVTGSSTPPASAFDSTKTNTSAAHGATAAEQQQAQQQRTAGAPVGGIPHAMAPGAAGGGGAPRTRDKDDKDAQVLSTNGGLDHGQTVVSEAVRGGTIAQNRDGKAA
ncbi:Uncharacterised protein [Mycobacteroides abscessus subsp. abscessus]|uniref:hypothetical protein n=1 Tax=Mycobacteroides abscessus TaxID=36809 RepID=UPI0009A71C0B|nr:hypothetical protein [Mycobacteroides abscessus]SLJ23430.1 Uncharacterised protein [Mycobacteroides abscessus subsp. abscessus]